MHTLEAMFTQCPKCGHEPLPTDQTFPTACPACGVILAKVVQALKVGGEDLEPGARRITHDPRAHSSRSMDPFAFWPRVALLAGFAVWGFILIGQDYRSGEIGASFIHRPLLIFHEAGHVVFRLLGEWMSVLGGSLGQLIMPAVLGGALLLKNRDPYGASIGLWLVGVSLLDLAPYMYDALHPQLMLLSGMNGDAGGQDWIYLFSSLGLLQQSQIIGGLVHKIGALTVMSALCWGAWVLRLQHAEAHGEPRIER